MMQGECPVRTEKNDVRGVEIMRERERERERQEKRSLYQIMINDEDVI